MSNTFGIPDSLLDAVKQVQNNTVAKHAAFGYVTEKKKMDPVGKADADIDNDGDVDKSDEYLHNRRKAIKKAMSGKKEAHMNGKKDKIDMAPKEPMPKGMTEESEEIEEKMSSKEKMKRGLYNSKDSGLENPHNCATHVYSEQWGDGTPVKTMHANPDENGNIAWYDVMFEHGIEKRVPIEELKVIKSSMHGHARNKEKK